MPFYDITLPLSPNLPVWPGDPPIELERIARMEDGAPANVSRLAGTVHIGTHIDAPRHFIADGATVDTLPPDLFIGRAVVVDLTEAEAITAAVLEAADIPPRTRRLLLKTRNSALWAAEERAFREDYVAVTPDGAEWLVRHGVRLVGVDYLSVAPYTDPVPTHRILLGAGVVILEGVNLAAVPPGRYTLYCLPLRLQGAEGAPARALLVPLR